MSFLAVAQAGASVIGSIFSNPNDAARKVRIDQLKAAALAGDGTALLLLECYSGNRSVEPQIKAAGLWGPTDTACGLGGNGQPLAEAALAEIQIRTVGSTALTAVGLKAIETGAALSPAGPGILVSRALDAIPTWVKVAGVAAVALVVWKVVRR